MRLIDKLRKDWEWWRESPHREESTVAECFKEADAYIAALESEREDFEFRTEGLMNDLARMKNESVAATALMEDFRQQMEEARRQRDAVTTTAKNRLEALHEAEAEAERLHGLLYGNGGEDRGVSGMHAELWAENARLRVCGTCYWFSHYGDAAHCDVDECEMTTSSDVKCLHKPSRWTPYWETD